MQHVKRSFGFKSVKEKFGGQATPEEIDKQNFGKLAKLIDACNLALAW